MSTGFCPNPLAQLILAMSLLPGLSSLAGAEPAGGKVLIGVAAVPGTDSSDSVRQALMSQLQAQGLDVVPLGSGTPEQVDSEAHGKSCQYVLQARVQQKHGMGGMLSKLSSVAGVLPFAAAAGGGGGGGGGLTGLITQSATQMASQAATQAVVHSAQQQATAQITGAAPSTMKRGDTLALDYRLTAVGNTTAVKSESLSGKAGHDGEDVLTPLLGQVAGAVRSVARGEAAPTTSGSAGLTGASTPAPPPPSGSAETHGKGLIGGLGGLFNHHASSATSAASAPQGGMPDCAQLASMPNPPISFEACQKMNASQQAYTQAASDPSASRPGDAQMTCDQILAELRQQQFTAPDKAKAGELQATAHTEQGLLNRHVAESNKIMAEEQAKVDAALAVDRAAEMASMGIVRPHATDVAVEASQARVKAEGERMARERRPTEQKLLTGVSDVAGDAGQQLAANPRLARLMQLTNERRCKGG